MIGVMAASGQLGGGVVRHLLASGVEPARIAALVRSPEKLEPLASNGVQVRPADYSDPASMPELAGHLSDATGRPIRFETVGDDEFLGICLTGGEPPFISRVLVSLYHAVDASEFAHATDHIERLTGTPARGARDYLMDVLSDLRDQPLRSAS